MIRLFQFVAIFVFLCNFSCTDRKYSDDAIDQQEVTVLVQPLDSVYNSYRVSMSGYDTAIFNKHYKNRTEPPFINLNESLDGKSISDLFLMKNTLLAMKGQIFEDAILAGYFGEKNWYQPPYWDEAFAIELNEAENTFLHRIDARLKTLRMQNFTNTGWPDPQQAINLFQFSDLTIETIADLERNGFTIIDRPYEKASDIYTENIVQNFPVFITTDFMLHQMHQLYGLLENDIEEQFLTDILKSILEIVNVELYSSYEKTLDSLIEKTIEESLLYYSIPYAIITGNKTNLIGNYNQIFYDEIGKVLHAKGKGSKVFKDDDFNYSAFRAYGHYAKNEKIEKYYKAMTWLQKIDLCLNDQDEFSRAILIAYIIHKNADLKNNYKEFQEIKAYFSSQKEQFTFWDLAEIVGQTEGINVFEDLFSDVVIAEIKHKLRLSDQKTCTIRVSLMPVENQNLFTDLSQIIKNSNTPSPIQIFAALGNDLALRSIGTKEDAEAIMSNLLQLATQEEAKSIDWLSTLLTALGEKNQMPGHLQRESWQMKQLNAAMSSWVQLNERVDIDTKSIEMPAKNSYPNTLLAGYVEPNVAFWKSAITVVENTQAYTSAQKMLSKRSKESLSDLIGVLTFLRDVSEKELSGTLLSAEDFKRIAKIGLECNNMIIKQIHSGSEMHAISSEMCYVTNIFHGGRENHRFAGIGPANEILVPVEIGGYIYLTRGFVYSYYELPQYPSVRISQAEWQKMVSHRDSDALSPWMAAYYTTNEKERAEVLAAKK